MDKKISVIINTLNEERNIKNCLESVKWADEIILVDMYSDDRTVEIAREYTSKIYMHKRMGYADPARQFALEKVTNEWVLVIDADEIATEQLREKLIEIIFTNLYDAVNIPRKNYFFGHLMKGTGWGSLQDKQLRFFRKDNMTYSKRVHNFTNLSKDTRVLNIEKEDVCFIHFNMSTVDQYIEKFNRYTKIEALNDFEEGIKYNFIKGIKNSIKEVIIRYFFKKGYKDGIQGIFLAILMGLYRVVAEYKLYLIYKYKDINSEKAIQTLYENIAKEELGVLRKYGDQS